MDDYEVKLTGKAQRQLQEIVRYIAEDLQEPATAERMLDSMEKEIMSLSTLPNRVALTTEEPWHSAGIHKMPVKNYPGLFFGLTSQVRKCRSPRLCMVGGIREAFCKT